METDIAREATQTLKDLELEFKEELRLAAAASASAKVAAGQPFVDNTGPVLDNDSMALPLDSAASAPVVASQGKNADHGRLRR